VDAARLARGRRPHHRAYPQARPKCEGLTRPDLRKRLQWSLSLAWLANRFANSSLDRLSEDIAKTSKTYGMLAYHVGVDPQGYGWVGVAEPGSHDMDRDPGKQQCGGVQVPQVMQASMR
jgi:hypothetical protein